MKETREEKVNRILNELSDEQMSTVLNHGRDMMWLESFSNLILQCPNEDLFDQARKCLNNIRDDILEKNS